MIDWEKRLKSEFSFFNETIEKNSSILDLGCGVGHHALEFAKLGHTVNGIDIDPQMIEKATQKARLLNLERQASFEVGSFEDLIQRQNFEKYTHIVCIGNSLSLIQRKTDLTPLTVRLATLLTPRGQLILQILNYELLEAKDPYYVLIYSTSGFFLRVYESFGSQKTRFTLIPILKSKEGNWDPYTPIESFLWKIFPDELVTLLENSGFVGIKLYGSYTKANFAKDSPYLLLVATLK